LQVLFKRKKSIRDAEALRQSAVHDVQWIYESDLTGETGGGIRGGTAEGIGEGTGGGTGDVEGTKFSLELTLIRKMSNTITGRIPLEIDKPKLTYDDALLYLTPIMNSNYHGYRFQHNFYGN